MAIIYDLIRKSNRGEIPSIEERWVLRNEYSTQFDNAARNGFRDEEWRDTTINNLNQLFDSISNYKAPVFNKHVTKILWAFDIKRYTMTIQVYSHFHNKPKTFFSILKNISNVLYATITLSGGDMASAALGIHSKQINHHNEIGAMLSSKYNEILYQTKHALICIGINEDEATKIIDIKGIGGMKNILGINRYDSLSAQFFYL